MGSYPSDPDIYLHTSLAIPMLRLGTQIGLTICDNDEGLGCGSLGGGDGFRGQKL